MVVDSRQKATENASVNLKVVHLLHKLEMIERDLAEITAMQESLKDDRGYAARLRDSLGDEALRLKELQSRIRSQVIRNPPRELQTITPGASQTSASAETRSEELWQPPEITGSAAPAKNSGGARRNRERDSSAQEGAPADRDDFNFRFIQN